MNVNYLLAACAHRAGRVTDYGNGIAGKDILRLHLEQLLETDLSKLSQVTIIRSLPLLRNGFNEESEYYWDIDDLIEQFPCKVEVVDFQDRWFSYSLYINAIQKYGNNFDYYILCEDDYYPEHFDFVNILVSLHKKYLPLGGYLSSFVTDHSAVSNGIVDAASVVSGISKFSDPVEEISPAAQIYFGTKLFRFLADYSLKYRTLGWFGNGLVELLHQGAPRVFNDLFNPVQYLGATPPAPKRVMHGKIDLIGSKKVDSDLYTIEIC